ncbi:hypothetical protein [Leifsonia poae]|uniref:hypothetical protein n=1 Tax=Leifsonia poae TaxID=110933 RepID=UPI001CBF8956|nr:hypothetical protein [Leifsonia poae]
MKIDADALLSGPRGRRASLSVAAGTSGNQKLSATLLNAIMELGGELDPSTGAGRAYLRFEADNARGADGYSGRFSVPGVPPIESADDLVAALLDAPILTELINPLDVLEEAVSSARYWQEPDGEDFLCALPILRPALQRAAEVLLGQPGTEWWDAPIDRSDQWDVDFEFGRQNAPRVVRPDIRTFRAKAVAEEHRARRDRPSDLTASFSGSWWSTPLVPLASFTTTRSVGATGPVGLHLIEDSMGWEEAQTRPVGIDPRARVYEISTADDWAELCRRFPLDLTSSRRHDWYRATGRIGEWVIPDWTSVGEHFDGVHLSAAAYLQAAGLPVPVDGDTASLIAGWGPDETWWFRLEVVDIGDGSVAWHRRGGAEWRPR